MIGTFFEIADMKIPLLSEQKALERVSDLSSPKKVFFMNGHTIMVAKRNASFHEAVCDAHLLLNMGAALELASQIKDGVGFPHHFNQVDFITKTLEGLPKGTSVFFLGSKESILHKLRPIFITRWPHLHFQGSFHGNFLDDKEALSKIEIARPEVLLISLSEPRQGLFLHNNWEALKSYNVRLAIGCGIGIEQLAGHLRPPSWVRDFGFEWLFNIMTDPLPHLFYYLLETPLLLTTALIERITHDRKKTS